MQTTSLQQGKFPWEHCNDLLNSLSDRFSKNTAIPVIKSSYLSVGSCISECAGLVSTRLKDWLEDSWCDPLTSSSVLRITQPIERLSLFVATQNPTKIKQLRYLNICLISSAQDLYSYLKNVNYILNLPTLLKQFFATFSVDNFINRLSVYGGKSFVIISDLILIGKYIILTLIDVVIKVVDFVISLFTFTDLEILAYLREIIQDASDNIHLKFVDIASMAIDKIENRFRKKVVVEIANYALNYTIPILNRIALKSLIGVGIYFGAQYSLQSTLSTPIIRAVSLLALSGIIWGSSKPTLDAYYTSYNKKFDPDASFLMQFLKRHSITYLYPGLSFIQKYAYGS